jgi:hypothetical protein
LRSGETLDKPWLDQEVHNRMRPLIPWPPGINIHRVLVRESRSSTSSRDKPSRAILSSHISAINLSGSTIANTNPNPAQAHGGRSCQGGVKGRRLHEKPHFIRKSPSSFIHRPSPLSYVSAAPAIRMAAPRMLLAQVTSSLSTIAW